MKAKRVKTTDGPMTTYNQPTVGATSTALMKASVTGVTPTNHLLPTTKTTDWKTHTGRMIELLTKLNAPHYIKHDPQPYQPRGYNNPMRVAQHH